MNKHTEGLWKVDKNERVGGWAIFEVKTGHTLFMMKDKANAEFIVRACDSFYELSDALRTMIVATDSNAPLPKDHPGHEAYLHVVAIPRAKKILAKIEEVRS